MKKRTVRKKKVKRSKDNNIIDYISHKVTLVMLILIIVMGLATLSVYLTNTTGQETIDINENIPISANNNPVQGAVSLEIIAPPDDTNQEEVNENE